MFLNFDFLQQICKTNFCIKSIQKLNYIKIYSCMTIVQLWYEYNLIAIRLLYDCGMFVYMVYGLVW